MGGLSLHKYLTGLKNKDIYIQQSINPTDIWATPRHPSPHRQTWTILVILWHRKWYTSRLSLTSFAALTFPFLSLVHFVPLLLFPALPGAKPFSAGFLLGTNSPPLCSIFPALRPGLVPPLAPHAERESSTNTPSVRPPREGEWVAPRRRAPHRSLFKNSLPVIPDGQCESVCFSGKKS